MAQASATMSGATTAPDSPMTHVDLRGIRASVDTINSDWHRSLKEHRTTWTSWPYPHKEVEPWSGPQEGFIAKYAGHVTGLQDTFGKPFTSTTRALRASAASNQHPQTLSLNRSSRPGILPRHDNSGSADAPTADSFKPGYTGHIPGARFAIETSSARHGRQNNLHKPHSHPDGQIQDQPRPAPPTSASPRSLSGRTAIVAAVVAATKTSRRPYSLAGREGGPSTAPDVMQSHHHAREPGLGQGRRRSLGLTVGAVLPDPEGLREGEEAQGQGQGQGPVQQQRTSLALTPSYAPPNPANPLWAPTNRNLAAWNEHMLPGYAGHVPRIREVLGRNTYQASEIAKVALRRGAAKGAVIAPAQPPALGASGSDSDVDPAAGRVALCAPKCVERAVGDGWRHHIEGYAGHIPSCPPSIKASQVLGF